MTLELEAAVARLRAEEEPGGRVPGGGRAMKLLFTVAAVLLALLLLGQVRVGCVVSYQQEGLFLWLRTGVVRIRVLPWKRKKKEKPVRGKKMGTDLTEEKPVRVKGGGLEYAKRLLPIALEAAGQFQKKLKIDILDLELTIGGQDPADAAMAYGWANGALGALWYPLVEGFHIVDGRARVRLDLEAPAVSLRGRASLSLKLGQICRLAVYFGIKALRAVMAARGEQKEQNVRKAA